MIHKTLREQILKDLKKNKESIRNIEKLAGIGKGSLGNFLTGRTKSPTLETLRAVSNALRADLTELLGLVSGKESDNNDDNTNLELLASVFNHSKQFFLAKNFPIKNKDFFDALKTIYYFSLSRSTRTLDEDFANWYLEAEINRIKPPDVE
jgi:transcriptional regulator with XRE-family HTH domain